TFDESKIIDSVIDEADFQLKTNLEKLSKFTTNDFLSVFEELPIAQIKMLTTLLLPLKMGVYQDIKQAFNFDDDELILSELHQVALSTVLIDLLEMEHE